VEAWFCPILTSAIDKDKWIDLHHGTCYKERTPVLNTRRLVGAQEMSGGFREEKTEVSVFWH